MLQRILNVLDVREDVVNLLIEDPVNSIDELTELNQKLEDKDYAKQMVVISVKTHLFRLVVSVVVYSNCQCSFGFCLSLTYCSIYLG